MARAPSLNYGLTTNSALAGSAVAAPALDRTHLDPMVRDEVFLDKSHDQQPIWQDKIHTWFCNHHPHFHSRWCQPRGSPLPPSPPPPPPLSPPAPDTPFQPQDKDELGTAVKAWCTDEVSAKKEYGDIAVWDVSEITSMMSLFATFATCNPDISKWNTGKVTTMWGMFASAKSFSADLSKWDTGEVTSMWGMFYDATSFNADLSKWDTGKMFDQMGEMFHGATSFTDPNWCPPVPPHVNPPKLVNGKTC